jgi:hypothetical protein
MWSTLAPAKPRAANFVAAAASRRARDRPAALRAAPLPLRLD